MQLVVIACEAHSVDKAKTKVLVSILRDSSLYQTMPHEEKMSLLSRLEKDYPSLFSESNEDDKKKSGEI